MYFMEFQKRVLFKSYACTHVKLTKFCHLIVIIVNVLSTFFIYSLDLLNVLTPLQIRMHLSGSLFFFTKLVG